MLLGVTKYKIKEVFDKVIKEKSINLPIYLTQSLEEAVKVSLDISEEGDSVVLSPACAICSLTLKKEGKLLGRL